MLLDLLTAALQWHSISQSRPHSLSEAGHKTRPLAFVTQRVTATLIANRVSLGGTRRNLLLKVDLE